MVRKCNEFQTSLINKNKACSSLKKVYFGLVYQAVKKRSGYLLWWIFDEDKMTIRIRLFNATYFNLNP